MAYLGQPPANQVITSADITDNIITAPKLNSTDVTAFIKTMLNDADASAALTTLGFSTFFKTLVDDAAATNVLTTLGFSTFFKTLIDDADAATTFANIKQDATDTATGVAERATNTEALGGTDATRFVTSAGLASVKSLVLNGYMKLPGGLLIQQGFHTCSGSAFNTLTFPTGFTSALFVIVATVNSASANSYAAVFDYGTATLTTIAAASVTSANAFSPQQIRYFCVGV